MPRSVRIDPKVYFGTPGNYVELPWPRGGVSAPADRATSDFLTGSGSHRISSLIGVSRAWTLNWLNLHQSSFELINQFYLGMNGVGPWVFIDPSRPNLLTPNQSAATSVWNANNDFTSFSGTIVSNRTATFIRRQFGTRSIQWKPGIAGSGATTINLLPQYSLWPGFPVVPGRAYCWQYWGMTDGGAYGQTAQLRWYNAAGTQIRLDISPSVSSVGWNRLVIGGDPLPVYAPPNAAFARPEVALDLATITTASTYYVDMPNFEQSERMNEWAPGTGILPVKITGWTEDLPFDAYFRSAPTLSIREVK